MSALSTKTINDFLHTNLMTRGTFLGTHPSCIEPVPTKNFYSFITNTQTHEKSGEHWNGWVIDNKKVFFFDSFGRGPRDNTLPIFYRNFIKKFKHVYWVRTRVQDWKSETCGYFCIHFIYLISTGFTIKNFLSEYTTDYLNNDDVVVNIYNII